MPEYILHRTHLLSTTNGVVSFEKDEPTWVPNHMIRDAEAIGAIPVDGDLQDPLGEEKKLPEIPVGDDRKDQIFTAFELLIERNEANDFTGQGVPTVKAVEKIVGFDVERSEVLELWAEHKVSKAG